MACVDTMGSSSESPGAGVWLHGEAVAAGMVMAANMSLRLGWIEEDILHRTVALLEMAELPTKPPQVLPFGRPFMQLCSYAGSVNRHSGRCLCCAQMHVCCCGFNCARVMKGSQWYHQH